MRLVRRPGLRLAFTVFALLTTNTLLSFSCGGTTMTPTTMHTEAEHGEDGAALVARLNAAAREGAVFESIHEIQIADPYRSLETESEGTRAWINAQNARTAHMLGEWTSPTAAARIDALLSIGVVSSPTVAGARIFYMKRDADREQPVLLVSEDGVVRATPLVDPATFGERAALDWFYPSPAGRYVAFGISQNGDERSTLHVIDVTSGELLSESIPRTKWSNVAWLHSEDGFYYSRYPRPGEDNFDAEAEDTYFPRIYFHRLGADTADDPLFFGSGEGTDFPSASVSDDDRYVVINAFRGWSESDLFVFDRGAGRHRDVPQTSASLRAVVRGRHDITTGRVYRGQLYLYTNVDAPRYRIAKVAAERAAGPEGWTDVVPETDAPIEGWAIAKDRIVVHVIDDVRSRVRLYALNGDEAGEVELPGSGSIDGVDADPSNSTVAMTFSSYIQPPTVLLHDVSTGATSALDRIEVDLDFSNLTSTRSEVRSADGTMIPVTLVHARDMEPNGQQPVLLYGYGGFNVSLLPGFTRNALYWVERGGVYAVANLRGGGERGEEWHRAGNLENKERVFEDFEAVIRWLSDSGLSRPGRIAITGGSNGGLLMGAMITRCPDAFAAAATYVGLYDMIRYHRFPPAELWISEYGSADDAAQIRWLAAYSPYHRIQNGTRYPSVLVETADHDSRVFWGHSTKFAARLQEAQAGDAPILFYMVRAVGHGAGTRRTDLVERYVRQYAFLEHALGML